MTERKARADAPAGPPPLAAALVGRLARPAVRDALLGDLHEEFHERRRRSPRLAKRWYWHQALGSVLPLAALRLRSDTARAAAVGLAVLIAGLAALGLWELHVARQSAYAVAARDAAPNLLLVRGVYFALLALGFAAVGGAVAGLAFRGRWRFRRNLATFLGPLALAVLCTVALSASPDHAPAYTAFRAALPLAALALGAR
ncbi:MAG: permease prefix domain 2-containing transporter, partial [Pseudomonadota bacterium]